MRPHRRQPTRLPRPWDSPGKNTGVGCHFLLQCMKVERESKVAQSRPTLCDPMDCSLPGSSIHGIFQARVLESQPCSTSQFTIILPKIISQISTCMWIPVSALLLGEPSLTQLWKTKQRLRSCSKLEVRRHTGARERHGLGSKPRWWWGWGATNSTVRRISKIWL